MGILSWIIFGLIVGVVASMFVPGESPGLVGDIVVGVLGAFIGGWVYGLFGHIGVTGFNLWSFICAIVGAVILLTLVRLLRPRRYT